MHYLEQIIRIIFDPEYTTIALHDSPHLRESFFVVSAYALATSVDSFLVGYLRTETLSIGLMSFLVSIFSTYLLWIILASIFHIAADMLGGLGEFPDALGFVGLATAPLIFTSLIAGVLTVVSVLAFPDDDAGIIPNISLGLTLLGMAWGAPGVICYFGMKNVEKLPPLKAFGVTFILFLALAVSLLV